jgi:hypothetical protein
MRAPDLPEVRIWKDVMAGDGYKGGPTPEGKFGCLIGSLIGVPTGIFLLLADALGDCAPDGSCHHGFLLNVLLPSVGITAVVGLAAWWIAKTYRRNVG